MFFVLRGARRSNRDVSMVSEEEPFPSYEVLPKKQNGICVKLQYLACNSPEIQTTTRSVRLASICYYNFNFYQIAVQYIAQDRVL
jgi:hypothetical protein